MPKKSSAPPYRRPTRPTITDIVDAALWKAYTWNSPAGDVSMEVKRVIGIDADGKAWRFWSEVRDGSERLRYGYVRRGLYDR